MVFKTFKNLADLRVMFYNLIKFGLKAGYIWLFFLFFFGLDNHLFSKFNVILLFIYNFYRNYFYIIIFAFVSLGHFFQNLFVMTLIVFNFFNLVFESFVFLLSFCSDCGCFCHFRTGYYLTFLFSLSCNGRSFGSF